MKKFKFLLGSAAFLVAVGGAFASKNASTMMNTDQYYEQIGNTCVPSNCDPNNTTDICEFGTVYEQQLSATQCDIPVLVQTARQP